MGTAIIAITLLWGNLALAQSKPEGPDISESKLDELEKWQGKSYALLECGLLAAHSVETDYHDKAEALIRRWREEAISVLKSADFSDIISDMLSESNIGDALNGLEPDFFLGIQLSQSGGRLEKPLAFGGWA